MSKRVDVKLGFSCNNNCIFCVQGNKRSEFADKSNAEIRKILDESRKNHDSIVFTGGEVTIRKDLPELIAYARDIGFKKIQMQTNGRMLAYDSFCQKLIESGANDFGLALHGPTAKIHDELTEAKGSFDQTTRAIKNLVAMKQSVGTNSVITKPGYVHFPDLADLLIELGVGQYQFSFIHISKIIKDDPVLVDKIVPRKSEVMLYIKKGLQKGINAGVGVMTEAIPLCFMEGYEKYIAELGKIPDGAVYDADFSIENYQDYRKNEGKTKGEDCKKCKYFQICEGPWREYPEIFGWSEFIPVMEI